jgi:NADH:ubiquinone reductase (H+-translocating)
MSKHDDTDQDHRVLVVGGGFAGVGCARELAHKHIDVTLVDKNNYHQFQPLLYQLATAQVGASDIARPLRGIFAKKEDVRVVTGEVTDVDPAGRSVTLDGGVVLSADVLVLAAGAKPNFFGTPGAEEHAFPLYCLDDAERLRSRLLGVFDAVDRDPTLVEKGALTFVIVGAGATGVETAGAFADLIHHVAPGAYRGFPSDQARVIVVDRGATVLNGFSDKAHKYATGKLEHFGVEIMLGVGVAEVAAGSVTLTDGTILSTHVVVWAGGEEAASIIGRSGLPLGRGGRVDVEPDLTVKGDPGVYVLGDAANICDEDGRVLPQLGSVAQQSGKWAADNIVRHFDGHDRRPFEYHDKGIMAMIGRNAAVAEMGEGRHEIDGPFAFAAWLGVHATLLEGTRQKLGALMTWGWDYASKKRPSALVDHPDAYRIDWDDDDADT